MGTIIVLLRLLLLLIPASTFGGFMCSILLLLLLLSQLLSLFWKPTLLRVHKRNKPSQSRNCNFAECHHRYLLFIKLCVDKPFCDCQLIASAVSAYTALQKKEKQEKEKQKRHLGRASAGKREKPPVNDMGAPGALTSGQL